jgi:predicted dinucleotide-binding enzyme
MTVIGIIGSRHVGSNLARAAIAHGYDVVLSNSQGPDSLADLVNESGFDALDIGGLGESWRIDTGQPAFVVRQNLAELKANVARAKRGA